MIEVNNVVKKHFVKQSFKLGVVNHTHKLFLRFCFKISENVRRNILGKHTENKKSFLCLKLIHKQSGVNGVHIREEFTQRRNFSVGNKLGYFFDKHFKFVHKKSISFHRYFHTCAKAMQSKQNKSETDVISDTAHFGG